MSTLRVNNMTNAGGTGPTYASGHVIQTVSATFTTDMNTTSNSLVDTGCSLSITPKNANSKLVVSYYGTSTAYSGSGTSVGGQIAITDSANTVLTHNRNIAYWGTAVERAFDMGISLVANVTAGTTSEKTFKLRIQLDGSGTFGLRGNAGTPYSPIMMIQEVAA